VSNSLIKKNIDTDGNKVNWFSRPWIRYEKIYGKLKFKYSLNPDEPFRTLDLKRGKRGRPKNTSSTELTNCYTGPIGPLPFTNQP